MRMSSQDSVTTQLSTTSIPHEEAVLEHYFELVSQASYEKAKDLVDTEKDGHKFSVATSWGEILQCLSQLATAERNYANLVFLGQKRFTQIVRAKDSAKSIFSLLLQEFHRMENVLTPSIAAFETATGSATYFSNQNETDQLLAHISGQLCFFIQARMKMIEFYEQLASLGAMRHWLNFEDLVMMFEEVQKTHMQGFHHPLLAPIKTVFSLECESLCHLLHAQILMSSWSYLPCVLQLHEASSKLNTWIAMIPVKEVKMSFGRSSQKSNHLPPILNWLCKLKAILLSKFGLYFYDVISKQTTPIELKTNLAKTSEDYVGRIQVFQKKFDATAIYLVLDSNGLSGRAKACGYHHPHKYMENLKGLETYPSIFSFPSECSVNMTHWPTIVMLISSDLGDKLKFFYDKATEKRPHSSYFIIRVDPRISLVAVFESKKNEKDSGINSFMVELGAQLRGQAIMAALKTFARS